MGKLILAHEGTLERFTGDGMMIFFNGPVPVPDPAERAIRMAIAMRERVQGLAKGWEKRGYDNGGELPADAEIAAAHAFGNCIYEHARSRCFEIVSGTLSLIQHLIPQTGRLVLHLGKCLDQVLEESQDRGALRVTATVPGRPGWPPASAMNPCPGSSCLRTEQVDSLLLCSFFGNACLSLLRLPGEEPLEHRYKKHQAGDKLEDDDQRGEPEEQNEQKGASFHFATVSCKGRRNRGQRYQ